MFSRAVCAAAVLVSGCTEAPATDKPPEPVVNADVANKEEAPASDECRDWSKFDRSTLPELPKSRFAPILEQVWTVVLDKHYDPTLGCVDWVQARETYGQKLTEAKDRAAAYEVINGMLGELKQSHFRLFAPHGDEHGAMGPASPDMEVRWVENQVVVVRSEADGHLGPVHSGATLLGVGDESMNEVVERVRGRTKPGSDFAFAIGRAASAKLSCDRPGLARKVRVTDPTAGDKEVVRMVKCVEPQGDVVSLGNLRNVVTRVEHRMIEETSVGYLAFNIWMLPMVKRVEAALEDLKGAGMSSLVIDLRGNPGGVGPMSVPVARLVLQKAGSLGKLQFRDFEQEFNVETTDDAFAGPVAVLIDEGTASTSEIFAAGMRDLGRVKIYGGRASAGAALPSVIEELEGGAVLQYVVGDYHSPKGTVVEGKGIEPDVVVPETRADFVAGRDPVLEAAVADLQKG